ncbi:MAG: hypothetical protein QOG90_39 [Actinomycetota bacterium]|jgi:hypothetical protein
MEELATILRRERWLLSTLVFRLTELQHLLEADDSRFLGWASAEVEDAAARVREADLMRAAVSSGTVEVREPYGEIIAEHERVIAELVVEVRSLSHGNARLASDAIAAFGDTADLDAELAQVGYRTALAATEQLRLQTLTDFVR